MSHNEQPQRNVPSPIELLYGAPAGSITPQKGLVAAFAGQEIPVQPVPQSPKPKLTREQKAQALVESGSVQLPDLPVATILWTLHHGDSIPVVSQSDPRITYQVNGVCQCADFLRHQDEDPKWRCKHRLAAKLALLQRLEQEQEEDLLSVIPAGQHVGATSLRTWSTHAERIEQQQADWREEHVGVNETVYFFSDGSMYREDVTHH